MSDQIESKVNDKSSAISANEAVGKPGASQGQMKRTLKEMLMMAACCAAPLLVLAAVPFFGLTLGSFAAIGSSLLSIVALLACPVGMYLMMRMMIKTTSKRPSR
jgi:hypothetical protein